MHLKETNDNINTTMNRKNKQRGRDLTVGVVFNRHRGITFITCDMK